MFTCRNQTCNHAFERPTLRANSQDDTNVTGNYNGNIRFTEIQYTII